MQNIKSTKPPLHIYIKKYEGAWGVGRKNSFRVFREAS